MSFDYNSISAGYYDEVFKRSKGIQSKWHHIKFHTMKRRMGDYERHLDIGCGPGTLIGLLDQEKSSVGIDVSENQIDYAKSKYETANHQFLHVKEGAALPFEAESFDIVTIIEVIEHLPLERIKQILSEALRVLQPKGRLIVTTPNYQSLWPVLELLVNKLAPVRYEEQHVSKFTKTQLKSLFKDLSIADYSIDGIQCMAPFTAWIGWQFADRVHSLERSWLEPHCGLLLFAEIRKAS